jgi:anti-anti-sigma regulatory factor
VIRNEQPVPGSSHGVTRRPSTDLAPESADPHVPSPRLSMTAASMTYAGPHTAQRDRLGVLNVAGDLNREGLDLLRQRCRAELAAQVTTLVIDFTGMTDFPSALFSLLAETGASLRYRDARLQMIGLNEAIDLIASSGKQSTTASTA